MANEKKKMKGRSAVIATLSAAMAACILLTAILMPWNKIFPSKNIIGSGEDTAAADFDGQVDEQTKQDRYDIIMREQMYISADKTAAKVGKTIRVFCEGFDPVSETHFGRSEADAPDVDGRIFFTSKKKLPEGEFVDVVITEALDYDLIGKAL